MKKVFIIIGIILAILIAILSITAFISFGIINKEKTPISANTFHDIMKDKGYVMTDTTSQFAQYGNYVSKSYIAQKMGYKIEFYELSSKEAAINMYNTNKSEFELQKSNASAYTAVSINNYSTYSLTTNGKYKYLSRTENTLIYVDVNEDYKDTIKDIMKEIGY